MNHQILRSVYYFFTLLSSNNLSIAWIILVIRSRACAREVPPSACTGRREPSAMKVWSRWVASSLPSSRRSEEMSPNLYWYSINYWCLWTTNSGKLGGLGSLLVCWTMYGKTGTGVILGHSNDVVIVEESMGYDPESVTWSRTAFFVVRSCIATLKWLQSGKDGILMAFPK